MIEKVFLVLAFHPNLGVIFEVHVWHSQANQFKPIPKPNKAEEKGDMRLAVKFLHNKIPGLNVPPGKDKIHSSDLELNSAYLLRVVDKPQYQEKPEAGPSTEKISATELRAMVASLPEPSGKASKKATNSNPALSNGSTVANKAGHTHYDSLGLHVQLSRSSGQEKLQLLAMDEKELRIDLGLFHSLQVDQELRHKDMPMTVFKLVAGQRYLRLVKKPDYERETEDSYSAEKLMKDVDDSSSESDWELKRSTDTTIHSYKVTPARSCLGENSASKGSGLSETQWKENLDNRSKYSMRDNRRTPAYLPRRQPTGSSQHHLQIETSIEFETKGTAYLPESTYWILDSKSKEARQGLQQQVAGQGHDGKDHVYHHIGCKHAHQLKFWSGKHRYSQSGNLADAKWTVAPMVAALHTSISMGLCADDICKIAENQSHWTPIRCELFIFTTHSTEYTTDIVIVKEDLYSHSLPPVARHCHGLHVLTALGPGDDHGHAHHGGLEGGA